MTVKKKPTPRANLGPVRNVKNVQPKRCCATCRWYLYGEVKYRVWFSGCLRPNGPVFDTWEREEHQTVCDLHKRKVAAPTSAVVS